MVLEQRGHTGLDTLIISRTVEMTCIFSILSVRGTSLSSPIISTTSPLKTMGLIQPVEFVNGRI